MNKETLKKIEEAKKSKSNDYKEGYEICLNCGSYHPLGKGFNKNTVSKCPLCKPEEFNYSWQNPFVSHGGLGESGTGENHGLRRAFLFKKEYYISDNGLSLVKERLTKEVF